MITDDIRELRQDPEVEESRRLAETAVGAYGLDATRVSPLAYTVNSTLLVEVGAGVERYVLRVYRPDLYSEAAVRSELHWLSTLRRECLGVPEPVPTRDGEWIVRVAPDGGPAQSCAMFRWVEGEFRDGSLTPSEVGRVGELMARLHRRSESFVPPPGFERPRYDLDRLCAPPDATPDGSGGMATRHEREQLAAAARLLRSELAPLVEHPGTFGLIHGDLTQKNYLFHEGEARAIDFADFGWGFYPYDIAVSLLRLAERKDFSALRTAFLAGYRSVRALPQEQEACLDSLQLVRQIHLLGWLSRHLENPQIRERARQGFPYVMAQVSRYLDRRSGPAPPVRSRLNTVQFLAELQRRDIELWAEGDRLRFSALKGALTEELRAELAERKEEVLRFLRDSSAGEDPEAPAILPVSHAEPLPLSFTQERLWFFGQLEPENRAYNLFQAVRMSGPLRIGVLERSLREIVRRHAVLRTTFVALQGKPHQVISPAVGLRLPVIDLGSLPGLARETEMRRLVGETPRLAFDLGRGPLLRVALLRLDDRAHVFFFTIHHIVSDGWSSGLLIRELLTLYDAFSADRPSPLPEPAIQYADFAVWQRGWMQGPLLEEQLAYWRGQLEGAPQLLELPADRPRSQVLSAEGAKEAQHLSRPLTEALQSLCQRHGATLYMVLLAGFDALCYRYTGRPDVVVGSPIANRNRAELEGLIGAFVNTLVLRTRFSGDADFQTLVEQVRQTAIEAYARQDLPFEKLVEELRPERSRSQTPLFQVLFAFQNAPRPVLDVGELRFETIVPESGSELFDLTLNLWETPEGVRITWRYKRDLFAATTVRRMAGHFQALLEAVTAEPDRPLDEIALWTSAEAHQVLREWNDTWVEDARGRCLHELFEERAAAVPDALALVAREHALSYREIDRRADLWARYLQSLGVTPDTLVGVALERSVDLLVGLLAVLKAGGAYVPLDPAYPEARLAYMLEDAGAPVVLVHGPTRQRIAAIAGGRRLVCLDTDPAGATRRVMTRPPRRTLPDSLAYVIYTSGSTGRPKGVGVRHGGAVALVRWALEAFTDEECSGMLAATSVSFDVSVFELFTPLARGGTAVLVDNALSLAGLASTERITLVSTPPSAMAELLRLRALPPSVRAAALAGEALPGKLAEDLYRQTTVTRVCNIYGPTEATVYATFEAVPPDATQAPAIGRPIAGTRAYVLDRASRPVPLGASGELCLGGEGIARGYLHRSDITAERFQPDPFGGRPGARLYRTGDLVRLQADGRIEYLGRIDHQVKVRGFRIELGEIEEALRRQPGVREAAVVVREAKPGDRRLIACVVPDGQPAPPAAGLREALRGALPDYMVPSAFFFFDALPLTTTGKVDRQALAGVAADRPQPAIPPGAGGDLIEEMLSDIWAEVLGTGRPGVDDDFFEAGGHSLLATQVLSRIRETFEVELPLQRLFEASTVAALAGAVKTARQQGRDEGAPPIVPVTRERELPPSFAQQRLWFFNQLNPGAAYNLAASARLTGPVAPTLLARVFNELVRRHESLRTTFGVAEGRVFQSVSPELHLVLTVIDLAGLPAAARQAEAGRLTGREARQPFDLTRGPLLRVKLLRLEREEHDLLLTMHHIISDGWSMGVLIRELAALWTAFSRGEESPLPELPVQYADFAWWQRQWLSGAVLEAEVAYWKGQLAGSSLSLELPADRPRPAIQSFRGAALGVTFPRDLVDALASLSRRQGATLFIALLAGFGALLGRYTGQSDVLVGSPIAGRNRKETEGLIGFFVNTLVLRADLAGDPAFGELLGHLRATALSAYTHQDLPFDRLVEELVPERDLSRSPLFQVMLVLQNTPRAELELPDLEISVRTPAIGTAKFDLTLTLVESAAGLAGSLEYSTDLFDPSRMHRLLGHLTTLLRGAVADPARRLSDLPLLAVGELHQLCVEWNDTAAAGSPLGLHQRIEEQVDRAPDAIAWICGDAHLSYGGLDRRANRLAHHLRRLGVGPEVPVGLFLQRTLDLVVGPLGVLKAGGAYVPLDPSYPPERLRFMVEDSCARVLLTQEELRDRVPGHAARVVCLDAEEAPAPPAHSGAAQLESGAGPDNLAYLIYTSGSTGRPKGVMVQHRELARYLDWALQAYGAGEDQGAPVHSSLAFDLTVTSLWVPLLAGRTVTLLPEDRGVEALASTVRPGTDFGLVKLTPAHLDLLSRQVSPESVAGWTRALVVGGEALWEESVAFWRQHAPHTRIFNEYGPTETVVGCSVYEVPAEAAGSGPLPIGRPITGARLYVLDRDFQPVPTGMAGELWIGGEGVTRGYRGDPSRTAERFFPDPFSAFSGVPGARLYRSGDLARFRRDGELEYLGRTDDQLKIRGFRIEPGEVEETMRRFPGLGEVAVVVQQRATGSHLVAFYASPQSISAHELQQFLERALPKHMVPSTFARFDALPLTPNGKVDRRALAVYDFGRQEDQVYVAPRNLLELQLLEIWRTVLQVDPIAVTDNFFKLGGHSLLAIYLMVLIRERFHRELPVTVLFQAPTIERLAAVLQQDLPEAESPLLVPLRREGSKAPFFCVHGDGGNVFRFVELARHLGAQDRERPFYAFQAGGLSGEDEPVDSIEEMAAQYIDAIRRVQPQGPYHLAGYSMGGLIVYEMARRLRERGEEVAFLGMLDALADIRAHSRSFEEIGLPALVARELAIPVELEDLAGFEPEEQLTLVLEKGWKSRRVPAEFGLTDVKRYMRVMEATVAASRKFHAKQTYPGRIVAFRSENRTDCEPAMGWEAVAAGGVEVHSIAGDHRTIFESPNVETFAALLKDCLERAGTGGAP